MNELLGIIFEYYLVFHGCLLWKINCWITITFDSCFSYLHDKSNKFHILFKFTFVAITNNAVLKPVLIKRLQEIGGKYVNLLNPFLLCMWLYVCVCVCVCACFALKLSLIIYLTLSEPGGGAGIFYPSPFSWIFIKFI